MVLHFTSFWPSNRRSTLILPQALNHLYAMICLRHDPLGITREQTAHADVGQTQPELHDSLQTETATCVGRATISEAIDVVLCASAVGVDRWVVLAHLLGKQLGVVDTLSAGANFLTTHEEVVGVRKLGVMWRRHCVCGSDRKRELVENVEVGTILLEHQTSKVLFLGCAADCQCDRMKQELYKRTSSHRSR